MLAHNYAYFWDLWELQHKVIFDGLNKLIYISPSVTEINIRDDLYSSWKEWAIVSVDNMKWLPAFRGVGGDPLPGSEFLGRTFFLINGWRILLNHGVNFTGNIFTEEGDPPAITSSGVERATFTVSTLVVDNLVEAAVSAETIAQEVWDTDINSVTSGTSGGTLGEALVNIQNAMIIATDSVTAGSTSSKIQTSLSKANNYYDDHLVTVIDAVSQNTATRQIDRSWNTGQLDLIDPLPFTPSSGAVIVIVGEHKVSRGSIA